MLLIELDPESPAPAYLQIRDRIVALIEDGTLRPGDRLPPTRELASTAGVHRSTVVRAFEETRALDYLESRPGSYTTVRRRARPPAGGRSADGSPSLIDWQACTHDPVGAMALGEPPRTPTVSDGATIDFGRLAADPDLAPGEDLRRSVSKTLIACGAEALDYAEPAGWRPLRETVSRRLRAHGVAVGCDEILITNGAQQALDLVLRLLTRTGDRVVVEAPTYGMFHPLLRLHGVEPVEVSMTRDGMDLDALEKVLDGERPTFLYTMPNFHNPTGVTTDQAHRERLLRLCESHRLPIVEDGFEEEMKYFGRAVLPIKSMDAEGSVLYVGSFSKVVFPGLRIGWVAAPSEVVSRLAGIQHASCLAANTLAQAAADRFSRRGEYERFLRRIHRVYRRRMQAMLAGLDRHLPAGIEWWKPVGGYTLWLVLPHPVDAEPGLCAAIRDAGVRVTPGRGFFAAPPDRAHLRLSIACVGEDRIEEGCRRLGTALAGR
ncbi:MAG: PLP-dependent aminotransferase family protein [Candidatus Sulfomarinibacteraceae bacterium]